MLLLKNTSKYSNQDEEEFFNNQNDSLRCRSMHLKHNEKKYHVQFLKKRSKENSSHQSTIGTNRHLLLTEQILPRNIEKLFDTETSTTQEPSTDIHTATIHRESEKFNQK